MQPTIQIDSQHPVVSRLIELQASDSDRSFARDWLTVSETTWFRIKAGSYAADDHSKVLDKLTSDLAKYLDHLALTSGAKDKPILPLSHIIESRRALNIAFGEDRNRLIIALADTGGGKTTIVKSICRDFPGRVAPVEATEPWRNSYLAGLHGIGTACGLHEWIDGSADLSTGIVMRNDLIQGSKATIVHVRCREFNIS
jgi:hypothetical protein